MPHFSNPWKSGTILDCLDDVDACVVTLCFPCFVFSENRSVLHGGRSSNITAEGVDPCLVYCLIMTLSACTLQCLYAYSTRTDIRRKYDLVEQPCDDCSTHICCHFCALCQEYRELRKYPITEWPEPAPVQAVQPYQSVPFHHPQPQYIPNHHHAHHHYPASYPLQQRYQATAGSSGVSHTPSVASNPSNQPFLSSTGVPHVGYGPPPPQGYPVPSPQQPGLPRPLVYETHRAQGQYGQGNDIIPGIPAVVYQVPRFPNMQGGS